MADVLVMGAAIIRHGRVLVARRTHPPELAGGWEFPGGKVDPGEDPDTALVREVREELGCEISVTGQLSGESPISAGYVLRVAMAVLVEGEPIPHEHDAIRWLGPEELGNVNWLGADLPFLPELRSLLLEGPVVNIRAVFYTEDDARAVVERLAAQGFTTDVARERFAGEDDDEDHAWAVLTDAPRQMLADLLEEYDGWLDVEDLAVGRRPLDLPQAPKRIKNHFLRD